MARTVHRLITGANGFPLLVTTIEGLGPAAAKRIYALTMSPDPRKRKRGAMMLRREVARG